MLATVWGILMLCLGISVIGARNMLYSIFAFILIILNYVLLMIGMGADFLALNIMIIYVGAIAVLFLFVIMMLNFRQTVMYRYTYNMYGMGGLLLLFLGIEALRAVGGMPLSESMVLFPSLYKNWAWQLEIIPNIEVLGLVLYGYYYYVFYFVGIILLLGMIASIVMTLEVSLRKRVPKVERQVLSWTRINFKE